MKTKMVFKLSVMAIFLLWFANIGIAQQNKVSNINPQSPAQIQRATPEMIAERRTNHLRSQLNLNDEQYKQVKTLLLEDENKKAIEKQNIKEQKGLSKGQAKISDKQQEERIAIREKMKNILDKEQYGKFMEMENKHDELRKQRIEQSELKK